MKKIFILLVTFSFVGSALAKEQIPHQQIHGLGIYNTYVVIRLTSLSLNNEGCTKSTANEYVFLDISNENGKELYSAVLSARVAKLDIGFGVEGCRKWGGGTIPLVYRVDF